jgi:hypothetical protein
LKFCFDMLVLIIQFSLTLNEFGVVFLYAANSLLLISIGIGGQFTQFHGV